MLTKNARRNREIRKRWQWEHENRAIMNIENRPYTPMVCGPCGEEGTLLYGNARITAYPDVRCRCTNCGKEVVILYPSTAVVFYHIYEYASVGTKIKLALHRWLMDIL